MKTCIIKPHFKLLAFITIVSIALFSGGCQQGANKSNDNKTIPPLVYTKHARCRMDCRHINEAEIKEILTEDQVNQRKSDANARPCPTYAYEGYTSQHQHLRIVIGKGNENWKVITCIDLENEFACDCH